MKPETIDQNIDDFRFVGEKYDGKVLDTTVMWNGEYVCHITWEDRHEFVKEFNALLAKYRI